MNNCLKKQKNISKEISIIPLNYSLDTVLEKELQDLGNNTKSVYAPCWYADQVKIGEGVSEYQIEMVIKMTQMAMAFEGLELTEKDMDSLKAKYYANNREY